MNVTPLGTSLGAEVRGWDPERPLTPAELDQLKAALAAHRLLLLRGHRAPTPTELARFAGQFGTVAPAHDLYTGIDFEHDDVLAVSNELDDRGHERGVAGSGALPWHTDYAFFDKPAKETFLEAVRLPDDGGPNTVFCDMYAALEALPAEQREQVRALRGHHTLTTAGNYTTPSGDEAELAVRRRQTNPDLVYPDDGTGAWHPAVVSHPETGRESLYVSHFVSHFEGMEPEPSRQLVRELLEFATAPERVYAHEWRVGDLIVFDTVGTVHRRDHLRPDQPRTMRQLSTLLP